MRLFALVPAVVILSALALFRVGVEIQSPPGALSFSTADHPRFLTRDGSPLSVTFRNRWNVTDIVPLHQIPPLLQQAFITSEDKRFYSHHGSDYRALTSAVAQNARALRIVRGASTITEQCIRLLHPRPRTLFSRLVELLEARELERRFSKVEILEFYLNQVPYARNRRGVLQAAQLYFDRDLDTLSVQEMLALAVLVRAPSRYDLQRGSSALSAALAALAREMRTAALLTEEQYAQVLSSELRLQQEESLPEASHFLRFIAPRLGRETAVRVRTTIDRALQVRVKELLDTRVAALKARDAGDGAALVVDNLSAEVLAWVNAGASEEGSQIDAVVSKRQPGSTLKPFLYALALEKGWTPATVIIDEPLLRPVGAGIHRYRNYSGEHYGALRLREALANSLNIPAIKTIEFVSKEHFLDRLHLLGFSSLTKSADFYGEGLALGDGEVTLLELVAAYRTLASGGLYTPLRMTYDRLLPREAPHRVYSEEVATLVAHLLADPAARRLEFGEGELLNFPVETAVKTGTSTDYRDAWALGFSARFTAGVWFGNLDQRPMKEVSGSIGPALVLRAIFAELERIGEPRPLAFSPRLVKRAICAHTGMLAGADCPQRDEWFVPSSEPEQHCSAQHTRPTETLPLPAPPTISLPTPGLRLAMDPRIPDEFEAFPLTVSSAREIKDIQWIIDGRPAAVERIGAKRYLWKLERGEHVVTARVVLADTPEAQDTQQIRFVVQ